MVSLVVSFPSVESTALRLITALGSSEVQPQFTRFLNDPKTVLSAESEELNRALILTLARATHVTGKIYSGFTSLVFPFLRSQLLSMLFPSFIVGFCPSFLIFFCQLPVKLIDCTIPVSHILLILYFLSCLLCFCAQIFSQGPTPSMGLGVKTSSRPS